MLVMLLNSGLLTPKDVCQGCLWADRTGNPRWRNGHLSCAHAVRPAAENQPACYECEMGFLLADVCSHSG
ncbi:MAG: hypothetical protein BJG00_007245 [Limnothrix sp. CACIAM 69d]|nr:MAG: hypothetical protein BJG00_007245 [Limnothrix sp. CACIAM 69d]